MNSLGLGLLSIRSWINSYSTNKAITSQIMFLNLLKLLIIFCDPLGNIGYIYWFLVV